MSAYTHQPVTLSAARLGHTATPHAPTPPPPSCLHAVLSSVFSAVRTALLSPLAAPSGASARAGTLSARAWHPPPLAQEARAEDPEGAAAVGSSNPPGGPAYPQRWGASARACASSRAQACAHVSDLLDREIACELAREARLRVADARGRAAVAACAALERPPPRGGDPTQDARRDAAEMRGVLAGVDAAAGLACARAAAAAEASALGAGRAARSSAFPPPAASGSVLAGLSMGGGAADFSRGDWARVRLGVARERAEAADGLLRVCEAYRLLPASVVAGYLQEVLRGADAASGELRGAGEGWAGLGGGGATSREPGLASPELGPTPAGAPDPAAAAPAAPAAAAARRHSASALPRLPASAPRRPARRGSSAAEAPPALCDYNLSGRTAAQRLAAAAGSCGERVAAQRRQRLTWSDGRVVDAPVGDVSGGG